jgi:multisubunit Na+/H+ antiporter MnhB subunit
MPIIIVLLSLRITGMYFVTSEMSKKYLVDNISPILKKSNVVKDKLIDAMN